MSYEAEEFVKRMTIKSSPAKLIMLVLANRISNDSFVCFPGLETIAKETSKSVTQVKFHIARLVEAGLLIKRERKTSQGRWKHNEYEIVDFQKWYRRRYDDTPLEAETEKRAAAIPDDDKPIAGFPAMEKHVLHSRVSDRSIAGFAEDSIAGFPAMNPKRESKEESKKKGKEGNKPTGLISCPPSPSANKARTKQGRLDVSVIDGNEQPRTGDELEMDRADFASYCALAQELGLDQPIRLTSSRRVAIQAIRNAYGGSGWVRGLAAIRESKFLQGENKRGWRISFDYFVHEDTFAKVVEGAFGDRKANVVEFKIKPAGKAEWDFRLRLWNDGGRVKWFHTVWGPLPGEPGCMVPPDMLQAMGIDPETGQLLSGNTSRPESA